MKVLKHAAVLAAFFGLVAVARAADDSTVSFDNGGSLQSLTDSLRLAPKPAVPAAPAMISRSQTRQSGADLYYFTPEEGAAAAQRFGLRVRIQKANSGLAFDSDVPADIKAQMLADLDFMKTIQGGGATPLHQKIFGAVNGANYYTWFDTRVSGVGMDACGGGGAVACVIPMEDPSKMWLTQNFIKFSHPQIARLMVVYHEARHTETRHNSWPHATCPTPFQDANGKDMHSIWTGLPLAGEPACDITPLGSYGSSTILLKNVQKFCTNCTEKVKMDAGLFADDQIGRVIDPGAHRQMENDFNQ